MSELEQLVIECERVKKEADCIISKEEMQLAVTSLAKQITQALGDRFPIVIGIMNGGLIPMGMLSTELDFPLQMDYLHATRYRNKTSGGQLQWLVSPTISMQGRTVLLVDDIHDEGVTLAAIKDYCQKEGAEQVYSAVLVNKVHERKNNTHADFVALDIPDRYVFGCGMDYKGMLRHVAGVYAVKGL